MNFRSVNVIIKPRHIFPWRKQKIQVEGLHMLYARRCLRLFSSAIELRDQQSGDLMVRISQPKLYKAEYMVENAHTTYTIRKVSYWHWECYSPNEQLAINRLSGIKCILSEQGRQIAIMSLNSNIPFLEDRNTYIRVNNEKYMYLSIAAALILKGTGIHFNSLLQQNKLSPIRTLELAR